jgi:hypothetical protein
MRAVDFALTIDGAAVASWRFTPDASRLNFLHFFEVPSGVPAGDGRYARLTVAATPADGGAMPEVAIRQFDLQPLGDLMYGFDDGWHEDEYENATGLRWRWTSGHAVLRIFAPRNAVLRLRGESPMKYFDAPPTVRVTMDGMTLGTLQPSDDFTWQVAVPADAGERRIVLDTDRVYRPGDAEGTADARELGLRLFEIAVNPVAP